MAGEGDRRHHADRHRGLRLLLPVAGSVASTAAAATILYAGIDLTPLDRDQPTLAPPRASAPGSPMTSSRVPATESAPAGTPAPDPPSTGKAPAPPPPARRTPDRGDGRADALQLLRTSVQNGVNAREIRPDVGLDLTNLIDAALRKARAGEDRDVNVRIDQLRTKVVTRTRENTITPWRAARLQRLLDDADDQH